LVAIFGKCFLGNIQFETDAHIIWSGAAEKSRKLYGLKNTD